MSVCKEREKSTAELSSTVHRELIIKHSELSVGEEEGGKKNPHIGRGEERHSPPTQHTHTQVRNNVAKNIAN